MAISVKRANDKYRATLRSTWIADPAATTLAVTSIPANLPTYVTVGWNTEYETTFSVTGSSGSTSADYTLTGATRVKGANTNIPENTAVNCLNIEEFFNQYETPINSALELVDIDENAVNFVQINQTSTGKALSISATGEDDKIPLGLAGKAAFVKATGIYDCGTVGATETVSWKNGDRQKMTLDESLTITFGDAVEGQTLTLYMLQDGSGTNTITWADTIVWQDGITWGTSYYTQTASKMNIAVITYVGSAYYGLISKFA